MTVNNSMYKTESDCLHASVVYHNYHLQQTTLINSEVYLHNFCRATDYADNLISQVQ